MQGQGDDKGRNVLAVPEFGMQSLLRPYETYVAEYTGLSPNTYWIYLTENGQPLDPGAERGIPGTDPQLVRGMPCVLGQRIVLHLPRLAVNVLHGEPYSYVIMWRLRDVYAFRVAPNERLPYHLPNQGPGVPDTGGTSPGARTVVPASYQSVAYNQTEPPLPGTPAVANIRAEWVTAHVLNGGLPRNPGGVDGVVQQGVLPATTADYTRPSSLVHEVQAAGDEMLIAITRLADQDHPTWDFDDYDSNVAETFDAAVPDLGVRVFRGISP